MWVVTRGGEGGGRRGRMGVFEVEIGVERVPERVGLFFAARRLWSSERFLKSSRPTRV